MPKKKSEGVLRGVLRSITDTAGELFDPTAPKVKMAKRKPVAKKTSKAKRNPSVNQRVEREGGWGLSPETKRKYLNTGARGPLGVLNRTVLAPAADLAVSGVQALDHGSRWLATAADNAARESGLADDLSWEGNKFLPGTAAMALAEAFPFSAPHGSSVPLGNAVTRGSRTARAAAKDLPDYLSEEAGTLGRTPRQRPTPPPRRQQAPAPLRPEDFRQQDLTPVMARDDWAILTGENPKGQALSAAENAERNAKLIAELEEMGITPTPVTGHYGGNPENSFLVSPITQEQALRLGGKYDQDSVLTNRGLLYHDGTITPSDGAQYFDQRPEDYYSIFQSPDGDIPFAVNLKWGEDGEMVRVPDDLRTPGDYFPPEPAVPAFAQAPSAPQLVGLDGRPGEAFTDPRLISTRRPNNDKKGRNYERYGNPDEEILIQTGQAMRDAPRAFERNMAQISEEPFMQGFTGTPDEIYQEAVRRGADNLKFITEELMDPELVEAARPWYNTANRMGSEFADQYGVSPETSWAVNAVMSPQKAWPTNVANQRRLLEMYNDGFDIGSDGIQQGVQWVNNRLDTRYPGAVASRGPEYAARIMATPLEELTDPADRYAKVILTDAVRNNPDVPDVFPDGTFGGPTGKITWGSANEVGKALDILDNPNMDTIRGSMSGGGKVPSFYNNQAVPDAPLPIVTADTHSAGALSLFPGGGKDPIVYRTMGISPNGGAKPAAADSAVTGSKGLYGWATDAHTLAGQELGMLPREVQSVTWEGVRRAWGKEGKTPALKQAIADAWLTSSNPQEARQAIRGILRGQ